MARREHDHGSAQEQRVVGRVRWMPDVSVRALRDEFVILLDVELKVEIRSQSYETPDAERTCCGAD